MRCVFCEINDTDLFRNIKGIEEETLFRLIRN